VPEAILLKLLLHVCCGRCAPFPLRIIKEELKADVSFFYFNPNIHPFTEWEKRAEALKEYAENTQTPLIMFPHYDITGFLREVVFREKKRCEICYHMRLKKTVEVAKKGKYDFFSSTLLGSKQQNHELIKDLAFEAARDYNVEFFYKDFREGVKENIERSNKLNLYRQQYCGCIYSEYERYGKNDQCKINNAKLAIENIKTKGVKRSKDK
jgi:predicted adenine nucleotide alpha hydrolase (AANH) superfamily ATPase